VETHPSLSDSQRDRFLRKAVTERIGPLIDDACKEAVERVLPSIIEDQVRHVVRMGWSDKYGRDQTITQLVGQSASGLISSAIAKTLHEQPIRVMVDIGGEA